MQTSILPLLMGSGFPVEALGLEGQTPPALRQPQRLDKRSRDMEFIVRNSSRIMDIMAVIDVAVAVKYGADVNPKNKILELCSTVPDGDREVTPIPGSNLSDKMDALLAAVGKEKYDTLLNSPAFSSMLDRAWAAKTKEQLKKEADVATAKLGGACAEFNGVIDVYDLRTYLEAVKIDERYNLGMFPAKYESEAVTIAEA